MKKSTKMAAYIVALAASSILTLDGCTKDEAKTSGCDWESSYQAYVQKTNAYASNSSTANCVALKNAVFAFQDKVKSCTSGKANAEATASLKAATDMLKSIPCN